MNSEAERNRKELREIEQELLLRYEHISNSFGFQGLKAKLLSVLFISAGKPRSLTELAELTTFSKASVSRSMKELEIEIPFIIAVKKPQDKEKYYRVEVEFMDIITGFLVKAVHDEAVPTLEGTAKALERLESLKKRVKDEPLKSEIDFFIERTQYVNKTYKKYLWMTEKMIVMMGELDKEWRENHDGE
ncbi:MAG: hypothetical protein ACFE8Z_04060 [Candidatus Hermodarchaeota archaeon]